jgi:hypothetical protein
LEFKRQIGKYVHGLIANDQELMDEYAHAKADSAPYVSAWKRFIQTTHFDIHVSELVLGCPKLMFAGTLDLVGKLGNRLVLLDVKTTAMLNMLATALQTAAYEYLFNETCDWSGPIAGRYALHLKPNESYALVPFDDPKDFLRFLAHLRNHHSR